MFLKKKRWSVSIGIVVLFLIVASAYLFWQRSNSIVSTEPMQTLLEVESNAKIQDNYDVVVVGTDPEGVVAAISAARNGLKVLLIDGRKREILGGLISLGWLNSLDLNTSPVQSKIPGKLSLLNKGIFQEWYDQLEGTSVDITSAANLFYCMVKAEPNIDLHMGLESIEPITNDEKGTKAVVGIRLLKAVGTEQRVNTAYVIDATQDADIAALAGVPYTVGREDIGNPEAQQAVTLVFKLSGVTQEVWNSFKKMDDGTGVDKMSAWGFGKAKLYEPTDPERVGLRALNIGRQNDDTILINAMHILYIDPFDPESVKEGFEIGQKEAPLIAEYLKKTFKELKDTEFAGTAPELYVRETRHIQGEYRLTAVDVLDNRDFWDAIAYGSYEVDMQRVSQHDRGAIVVHPKQYGVPFRTLVPQKVDGLLVVGRAKSVDTIPHGSARVIPLGMATGEAAGAAAKLAIDNKMSFRALSKSELHIAQLRKMLQKQGMKLEMEQFDKPDYAKHRTYKGLLAAVSMFVTIGGDHNESWDLDGLSTVGKFHSNMAQVRRVHSTVFKGEVYAALQALKEEEKKQSLSLDRAASIILLTANETIAPENAVQKLQARKWVTADTLNQIKDKKRLTNGETFLLIRDVVEYHAGVVYE